jgi:DNA polymerase-3 subunit alpha
MVVVRGKLEKDDETARLVATEVFSIGTLRERVSREVAIRLAVPPHGRPTFEALADLLARFPGDRHLAIELELTTSGRSLRVRADVAQMRVRPSERLVSEVERLCGAGSVVLR